LQNKANFAKVVHTCSVAHGFRLPLPRPAGFPRGTSNLVTPRYNHSSVKQKLPVSTVAWLSQPSSRDAAPAIYGNGVGSAGRHPAGRKIRILQNKANSHSDRSGAWAGSYFDARSVFCEVGELYLVHAAFVLDSLLPAGCDAACLRDVDPDDA